MGSIPFISNTVSTVITTDGVHVVSFDRASQVIDAAISAAKLYRNASEGSVLIVDADKSRHNDWNKRLKQIGITSNKQQDVVGSTSAVQAILRFLSISKVKMHGRRVSCLTLRNQNLPHCSQSILRLGSSSQRRLASNHIWMSLKTLGVAFTFSEEKVLCSVGLVHWQ